MFIAQFRILFVLLTLSLSSTGNSQNGYSYLKLDYKLNFETIGDQTHKIVDLSPYCKEAPAISYPGINVVNATDLFDNSVVFMGFGVPNVYVARITQDNTVRKFDAKSLYREASKISETPGKVQSGFFIVLKDLTKEQIADIVSKSHQHCGKKEVTCVNANSRFLDAAGFAIPDYNLSQFYLPSSLLEAIVQNGITFQGEPIEFDIVKTTSDTLSEYSKKLKRAILETPIRHWKKKHVTEKFKQGAIEISQKVKDDNLELMRKHPAREISKSTYHVETSICSKLGETMRWLWGAHVIFKLPNHQTGLNISDYFDCYLKEFPQENPSVFTRIKKSILFTPWIVNTFRNHMADHYTHHQIDEDHFLTLIQTNSNDEEPFLYNFVLTDDEILIGRLEVQKKSVDWVLSKHVLLSNYSKSVRYAGEMWKDSNNTIHINTNSGTYRPSEKDLQSIISFARDYFPNFKFEGHVHEY